MVVSFFNDRFRLDMSVNAFRKQFGLLVSNLFGFRAMSTHVVGALQRAAERSKRRAELEVAKMVIERHLGYEIAESQFAWLSVLSMPQL